MFRTNVKNKCTLALSKLSCRLNDNMATSEEKRKKETVTKKTFLKWNSHEDFDYEVDKEDNIIKLTCKECCHHLQQIG